MNSPQTLTVILLTSIIWALREIVKENASALAEILVKWACALYPHQKRLHRSNQLLADLLDFPGPITKLSIAIKLVLFLILPEAAMLAALRLDAWISKVLRYHGLSVNHVSIRVALVGLALTLIIAALASY